MRTFFSIFIFISFISFSSFGQEINSNRAEQRKDWGFSITPYALLASQSTDVGGNKIRQSFNDLASITNSGFQIVTKVRYKRVSFLFDGTFANLSDSAMEGPFDIDLNIKQNIFDFKGSYLVYENFVFDEDEILQGWTLSVNAGAKYWKNKIRLDYTFTLLGIVLDEDSFTELQDWWDPMIGLNSKFVISKKFELFAEFNVGGFGIGNASKFAYDLTYINAFKVSKSFLINAGFRNFRYKRVDGEGDEELKTKVNVLGPVLGVTYKVL